jgi:hypothetical protein
MWARPEETTEEIGAVGTNSEYLNVPSADDDEYWEKYRARMTGELDAEAWMNFTRSRPK